MATGGEAACREKEIRAGGKEWDKRDKKMPTNFTVVPVKDGTRKGKEGNGEEDVDGNNVLNEEEDPTGEIPFCCFHLNLFRLKNGFLQSFTSFPTLF